MRRVAQRADELFAAAGDGDRAATARLLSLIERGGEGAREVGRLTAPLAGAAYTVGITGAPGSGKSTLTSAVIAHLRGREEPVAVLAVDPSSPVHRRRDPRRPGADAGPRHRPGCVHPVDGHAGHLGGLSLATPEAIRLLDALGHRWILVETVGVGQVEVEVAGKADTTVVVVNPGWGDAVQANKAGLMEVADVFVINKADRPGVQETRRDLEQMLELSSETGERPDDGWRVPIVPTVSTTGEGVTELWDAIGRHREHATASGELERRRRFRLGEELREIVARRLEQRAREMCTDERWNALDG